MASSLKLNYNYIDPSNPPIFLPTFLCINSPNVLDLYLGISIWFKSTVIQLDRRIELIDRIDYGRICIRCSARRIEFLDEQYIPMSFRKKSMTTTVTSSLSGLSRGKVVPT
jgi:hypothetical protein